MIKYFERLNRILEKEDVALLEQEASKIYTSLLQNELVELHLSEEGYSPEQAVLELGLDEELICELVEDYVSQVIQSLVAFERNLEFLQESKRDSKKMDYTIFREMAHKNLGVARNLRIKNAEILLYELMTKDDLEYLVLCLVALGVLTIKLNPEVAYKSFKSIR